MVKSPNSPYYSPQTKIILMTPPPVNTFQRPDDQFRKFEVAEAYAQAVRDVGSKTNTSIVDVFNLLWIAAKKQQKALEKYLSDGLHLTSEGYRVSHSILFSKWRTLSDLLILAHFWWTDQDYRDWVSWVALRLLTNGFRSVRFSVCYILVGRSLTCIISWDQVHPDDYRPALVKRKIDAPAWREIRLSNTALHEHEHIFLGLHVSYIELDMNM